LSGLLEIGGLWCLAVAQPLLEVVGSGAPFLLHHRVDGRDLAQWAATLLAGVPLALFLGVRLAARVWSPAVASRIEAFVLAVLATCFGLGMLRRLGDPAPPWLLVPIAVSCVWLVADRAMRSRRLRQFFALLSLAIPVVAALFWFSPAVRAARETARLRADPVPAEVAPELAPRAARPAGDASLDTAVEVAAVVAAETSAQPAVPIVLVIFDELPLLSILDAALGVDEDLCPNLARLSREATWYRNARTVSPWTDSSIASILIGRRADPQAPPTRASHPRNLLTWLASTHDVRAFELLTAMAPPDGAELGPPPPATTRRRRLTADAVAIVGHQLLPPALAPWLPPIEDRWGDFWSTRVIRAGADPAGEPVESSPWAFALADIRDRQFEAFLDALGDGARPGLFFAHVMLPHMPYRYLPSGAVYGGRPVYGRAAAAWTENAWFAVETYQRHLLQVGFVDHLVGRLRARLEALGLWDRTLVVLTSDHGASHWPGDDRRDPRASAHPDDVLQVPLFVKTPGQTAGGADDREAWSIDIVPTVADALGRPAGWPVEGRSLLGEATETVPFGPDRSSLERKLRLFDPAAGELRWVRLGPFRELIGGERADESARPAPVRSGAGTPRCSGELDQARLLETFDPASRYSPAFFTGEVGCEEPPPEGSFVLVSVNGTIAGSGALQLSSRRGGRFAAMTAPGLLRRGANRVELALAWDDSEGPVLARID
jgi:hypothetical protein